MKEKIKRVLAKYGIGNPLNMLIYSHEEIEKMRRSGKVVDYQPKPRAKIASFREKNKGRWGVQVGKFIVNISFKTREECQKWADWNYKKGIKDGNYKVILLF